jgi:malonyl-CoA decarboxylase
VPRFRRDFLEPALQDGSAARFYTEREARHLCAAAGIEDPAAALRTLLARPDWHADPAAADALKPGLLRAVRAYLTERPPGEPAPCPVADFHASNGALLARINWLADTSPGGLERSAGCMVNYLYELERFEAHQTEYFRSGRFPVARAVRDL